jgi:small-conductance mechanosensitive channel
MKTDDGMKIAAGSPGISEELSIPFSDALERGLAIGGLGDLALQIIVLIGAVLASFALRRAWNGGMERRITAADEGSPRGLASRASKRVVFSLTLVIDDPPPVAHLLGFGDSGIDLQLSVWIDDPEQGINDVRSAINLAIWRSFKAHGITIPFPQRDLHLKDPMPGFPGAAASS